MLKILQVVHGFPPRDSGGTEIYTYNLSRELSKRNRVYIFHRDNDLNQKEYSLSFKTCDGLGLCSLNNAFRRYRSFVDTYDNKAIAENFSMVLDKTKPDVVHIQHLLYLGGAIIEEIKKRRIPLIFTLNDYWLICPQGQLLKNNSFFCTSRDEDECVTCVSYQLKINKNTFNLYHALKNILPGYLFQFAKRFYLNSSKSNPISKKREISLIKEREAYMKNAFSRIDHFIAPSRFIKNKFIEFGMPEDKISFLNYGFNLGSFIDHPKIPSGNIRFGFVGSFLPAKGIHVLIEAFNKINHKNAELKIYGRAASYKSQLSDYPRYLKKLSRNKNIRFMGSFNNSDAARVFAEIDILVVPSIWYENSPLVIQEAFASKTPVIASNIGGIPELIEDGVNGVLSRPADPEELRGKINSVINNPSSIDVLRENINPPKDIIKNAEEIENIYMALMDK